MHTDLDVALEAGRAGAEVVRDGFGSAFALSMKGQVDPVTVVDTDAETAVREVLTTHRDSDAVLGEEEGGADWQKGRVWIVDPLDGTVNFVHGIPHVSVSVALWSDGQPVVGVVIDVMREEEFSAVAGSGAHLGSDSTTVSDTSRLGDSLVATGFPYDRNEHGAAYGKVVGAVLEKARGVRRLGSAALDFAWVACGRYDAYWEYGLSPWDAAAGIVLVAEAGGNVTDHAGKPYDLGSSTVVAANGRVDEELRAVVSANLPPHLP